MNRRNFIAGLAAAAAPWPYAATAACRTNAAVPTAPDGIAGERGYVLVRNWDFTTQIRDFASLSKEFHTRYIYANGTLDHLNDEWQRYRENSNHVFTSQGLSLTARAVGGRSPGSVESGMLRSRWTGKCGVFEIRMKVPRHRGLWPAFWLNPQDGRWPPEIDVVEIVNNGRDSTRRSFHFLHGSGKSPAISRASKLDPNGAYNPGFDYADAFHVFSVEWTPEVVRHFADGTLICERPYRWIHDDGTDAGPAHVLVNLAVGGKWPGEPEESALPATLQVAYIRVWQRRSV